MMDPEIVEMVNTTKDNFDEDDLVKFQELLLDTEKPLYEGYPDFTKLSAIVKLLNLKGKYGCSDKFFTELLGLLKKMLPGISRWKVDNKTHKVYKNIPAKAWRTIDEKFLKIAKDPRNLRLRISYDGVDVNTGNRHHSVWPVLAVIYNLPPCRNFAKCIEDRKTKDGVNARLDQVELGVKLELFAMQEEDKTTLPLVEAETAKPEIAEPGKPDVPECSKKADVQECSNIKEKQDQQDLHPDTDVIEISSSSSELECSSTSELECSSTSKSELSSYVSSYDESNSSDESGCLEKSVPGLMKMDEEEIYEDDNETDEQDDEIDEEAEDGKDDSDDELWSPKPLEQLLRNLSVQK
ncbi:putative reverse transcriptase domain-containing protein [Tanacetum coccineum]